MVPRLQHSNLIFSVSGLPLAADQASPERHVDWEAHSQALLGVRFCPLRGPTAQSSANGTSSTPPVNVVPLAQGYLQDVRLHRLPRCKKLFPIDSLTYLSHVSFSRHCDFKKLMTLSIRYNVVSKPDFDYLALWVWMGSRYLGKLTITKC